MHIDESDSRQRAQGASNQQVADIYERYSRRVYGFAMRLAGSRMDAEDLLSQTMIRAMSAINRGQETHGDIFPWLCTICVNVYRDAKRKARRERRYHEEVAPSPASREMSVMIDGVSFSEAELDACWTQVRKFITTMETARKTCLLLRLSGYSYREIADQADADEETVRSHIQNAMRELKRTFISSKAEKVMK